MKFIINKNEFLKTLLLVGKIIPIKSQFPILSNIKLSMDSNGLTLTGTSDEFSIKSTIPAFKEDKEIIREFNTGSILVNNQLLTEIIKRIEGDEISFELLDDNIALIQDKRSNFKLNCINADEYKVIDFTAKGVKINLSSKEFIDAINQVYFAASTKTSARPILKAIHFEGNNNKLIFVATDGARLAKKELNVEFNERFSINVPTKSFLDIVKSITNEENITIYVADKKLFVELENTVIATNLINGDYPNITNIIPKNFFYTLEVRSEEFLAAMDRMNIFNINSNEKDKVVKLIMDESSVTFTSKNYQEGSSEDHLELFKFSGERLTISFNVEYVASAIRALKSEDVMLSFLGEMKPFTVTEKNNNSSIQLITPVRVN